MSEEKRVGTRCITFHVTVLEPPIDIAENRIPGLSSLRRSLLAMPCGVRVPTIPSCTLLPVRCVS